MLLYRCHIKFFFVIMYKVLNLKDFPVDLSDSMLDLCNNQRTGLGPTRSEVCFHDVINSKRWVWVLLLFFSSNSSLHQTFILSAGEQINPLFCLATVDQYNC